MPANIDALIQEAQSALKQNRKADARRALDSALGIDEMSESAWLLMSQVVDADSDKLTCLENVLAINPNNAQAKKMTAALQSGSRASPFDAPPAPAASPFPDTNNDWGDWAGMDIPAAVVPPPVKPSTPSSVEWGLPADSAPADNRVVGQPSDADYDSWMAGLPLGGSSGKSTDKRSDSAGLVPAFDTSDFDSGPFSTTTFEPFDSDTSNAPVSTANRAAASPFGGFSFDDPPAPASAAPSRQDADPFGLRRGSTSGSSSAAAPQNTPDGLDYPVVEDPDFPNTPPAAPAAARGGRPAFSLKGAEPPALAEARKRQSSDQTYDDYQGQLEETAAKAKNTAGPRISSRIRDTAPISGEINNEPPASSAAVFTTIDSTPGMSNPSTYFSAIPEDIRNSNKLKPMLVASLVGLIVLNLVSFLLLLSNLAAGGAHAAP